MNNTSSFAISKQDIEYNIRCYTEKRNNRDMDAQAIQFCEMMIEYKEYINDEKQFFDILNSIKYINWLVIYNQHKDNWKCNKHIININGFNFDYCTGEGIKLKNKYTLLIDFLKCIIDDTNIYNNYNLDDFLLDFGYNEDLQSVRKGEKIYNDMRENSEKVKQIFTNNIINNIYDILEL